MASVVDFNISNYQITKTSQGVDRMSFDVTMTRGTSIEQFSLTSPKKRVKLFTWLGRLSEKALVTITGSDLITNTYIKSIGDGNSFGVRSTTGTTTVFDTEIGFNFKANANWIDGPINLHVSVRVSPDSWQISPQFNTNTGAEVQEVRYVMEERQGDYWRQILGTYPNQNIYERYKDIHEKFISTVQKNNTGDDAYAKQGIYDQAMLTKVNYDFTDTKFDERSKIALYKESAGFLQTSRTLLSNSPTAKIAARENPVTSSEYKLILFIYERDIIRDGNLIITLSHEINNLGIAQIENGKTLRAKRRIQQFGSNLAQADDGTTAKNNLYDFTMTPLGVSVVIPDISKSISPEPLMGNNRCATIILEFGNKLYAEFEWKDIRLYMAPNSSVFPQRNWRRSDNSESLDWTDPAAWTRTNPEIEIGPNYYDYPHSIFDHVTFNARAGNDTTLDGTVLVNRIVFSQFTRNLYVNGSLAIHMGSLGTANNIIYSQDSEVWLLGGAQLSNSSINAIPDLNLYLYKGDPSIVGPLSLRSLHLMETDAKINGNLNVTNGLSIDINSEWSADEDFTQIDIGHIGVGNPDFELEIDNWDIFKTLKAVFWGCFTDRKITGRFGHVELGDIDIYIKGQHFNLNFDRLSYEIRHFNIYVAPPDLDQFVINTIDFSEVRHLRINGHFNIERELGGQLVPVANDVIVKWPKAGWMDLYGDMTLCNNYVGIVNPDECCTINIEPEQYPQGLNPESPTGICPIKPGNPIPGQHFTGDTTISCDWNELVRVKDLLKTEVYKGHDELVTDPDEDNINTEDLEDLLIEQYDVIAESLYIIDETGEALLGQDNHVMGYLAFRPHKVLPPILKTSGKFLLQNDNYEPIIFAKLNLIGCHIILEHQKQIANINIDVKSNVHVWQDCNFTDCAFSTISDRVFFVGSMKWHNVLNLNAHHPWFISLNKYADKVSSPRAMIGGGGYAAPLRNCRLMLPQLSGTGYYKDNDPAFGSVYGALYNWDEANSLVPDGWILPGEQEWLQLMEMVDSDFDSTEDRPIDSNAGIALRANSWNSGTNAFGFNALPSGEAVCYTGTKDVQFFRGYQTQTSFWSSRRNERGVHAQRIKLRTGQSGVDMMITPVDRLRSVRFMLNTPDSSITSWRDPRDGQIYPVITITREPDIDEYDPQSVLNWFLGPLVRLKFVKEITQPTGDLLTIYTTLYDEVESRIVPRTQIIRTAESGYYLKLEVPDEDDDSIIKSYYFLVMKSFVYHLDLFRRRSGAQTWLAKNYNFVNPAKYGKLGYFYGIDAGGNYNWNYIGTSPIIMETLSEFPRELANLVPRPDSSGEPLPNNLYAPETVLEYLENRSKLGYLQPTLVSTGDKIRYLYNTYNSGSNPLMPGDIINPTDIEYLAVIVPGETTGSTTKFYQVLKKFEYTILDVTYYQEGDVLRRYNKSASVAVFKFTHWFDDLLVLQPGDQIVSNLNGDVIRIKRREEFEDEEDNIIEDKFDEDGNWIQPVVRDEYIVDIEEWLQHPENITCNPEFPYYLELVNPINSGTCKRKDGYDCFWFDIIHYTSYNKSELFIAILTPDNWHDIFQFRVPKIFETFQSELFANNSIGPNPSNIKIRGNRKECNFKFEFWNENFIGITDALIRESMRIRYSLNSTSDRGDDFNLLMPVNLIPNHLPTRDQETRKDFPPNLEIPQQSGFRKVTADITLPRPESDDPFENIPVYFDFRIRDIFNNIRNIKIKSWFMVNSVAENAVQVTFKDHNPANRHIHKTALNQFGLVRVEIISSELWNPHVNKVTLLSDAMYPVAQEYEDAFHTTQYLVRNDEGDGKFSFKPGSDPHNIFGISKWYKIVGSGTLRLQIERYISRNGENYTIKSIHEDGIWTGLNRTGRQVDLTNWVPNHLKESEHFYRFIKWFEDYLNNLYTNNRAESISVLEKIRMLSETKNPALMDATYFDDLATTLGLEFNLTRKLIQFSDSEPTRWIINEARKSIPRININTGENITYDKLTEVDGENVANTFLRRILETIPYFNKVKTTPTAITSLLLSFGLLAKVRSLWTKYYMEDKNAGWDLYSQQEFLPSTDNTYFPTPHFVIDFVKMGDSAMNFDILTEVILAIKPINTVFHGFNYLFYAQFQEIKYVMGFTLVKSKGWINQPIQLTESTGRVNLAELPWIPEAPNNPSQNEPTDIFNCEKIDIIPSEPFVPPFFGDIWVKITPNYATVYPCDVLEFTYEIFDEESLTDGTISVVLNGSSVSTIVHNPIAKTIVLTVNCNETSNNLTIRAFFNDMPAISDTAYIDITQGTLTISPIYDVLIPCSQIELITTSSNVPDTWTIEWLLTGAESSDTILTETTGEVNILQIGYDETASNIGVQVRFTERPSTNASALFDISYPSINIIPANATLTSGDDVTFEAIVNNVPSNFPYEVIWTSTTGATDPTTSLETSIVNGRYFAMFYLGMAETMSNYTINANIEWTGTSTGCDDLVSAATVDTISAGNPPLIEDFDDMLLCSNEEEYFTLSLTAVPTVAGTVTGAGEYQLGSIVSISAVANSGYIFQEWVDNENITVSSNPTFNFTIPGNDVNLIAKFTAIVEPEPEEIVFAAVGDIQIDTANDSGTGWANTLSNGIMTRNPEFIISMGDQIDGVGTIANELEAVAGPLRTTFGAGSDPIPFYPSKGNHEFQFSANSTPSNFNLNLENWRNPNGPKFMPSVNHIIPSSGDNRNQYWFRQGKILFIALDTSEYSYRNWWSAGTYIQDVINQQINDYDFLIVYHHKSTKSLAWHWARDNGPGYDSEVVDFVMDQGFDKMLHDNGTHLVLAGHDHFATRTKPLVSSSGNLLVPDPSMTINGNGQGTVFMTLNSSSGHKRYALLSNILQPDSNNNSSRFPININGTAGTRDGSGNAITTVSNLPDYIWKYRSSQIVTTGHDAAIGDNLAEFTVITYNSVGINTLMPELKIETYIMSDVSNPEDKFYITKNYQVINPEN